MSEHSLPDIPEVIASGRATDEKLAEFFGSDLMSQLAAQWRDPVITRRLFADWYVDVLKPLGIAATPAFELFVGAIAIDDFVAGLDDAQLDVFIEKFPGLQAAHQQKLDARQARRL